MEQLFESEKVKDVLKNKYIYLDNDFLSVLYHYKNIFSQSLSILGLGIPMVDSFTKFEFLRDVFIPQERTWMEDFIDSSIFSEPINHNDIFQKIQTNGMILSRIYSHQGKTNGISTVDLLLAGRLMYANKALLITGNKKDFPSCIFDTLGVVSIENKKNESFQPFCIIEFNKDKFEKCEKDLEKINRK
jgi:hypothetical protein